MVKIHQLPPLLDTPEIADVLAMDDASVSDPNSASKTKKISIQQLRDFINSQFAIGDNLLINGNFDVWQRNTTFTQNDDLYIADHWNALQEANSSWTFARDTDVPTTGSKYSLKASNATANNQAAVVQFLEGRDAKQFANQNLSLSFYAKTVSSEIANLRCAILSWTGTEDAITSDVISTWAQNGTNPTWATSWTMENVPVNLALTNSWAQYKIENVPIDTAGMKNIAVVIWVDDGTITSGDDFWLTQVMLNTGGTAATFAPRLYAEELAMCQRYYYNVVPSNQIYMPLGPIFVGASQSWANIALPCSLRTTPTLTTSGLITRCNGADTSWGTTTIVQTNPASIHITATTTGTSNGNSGVLAAPGGVLIFDAEL